jgi:hypothetical protein
MFSNEMVLADDLWSLFFAASDQCAGQQQTLLRYELLLIGVPGLIAIIQFKLIMNIVACKHNSCAPCCALLL